MQEKKKTQEISNYEKWCQEWAGRFLRMDHQKLKKLLPELQEDGDYFSLLHFGRRYVISKQTGEISSPEEKKPLLPMLRLNIYTLFGYVSPDAYIHGEWLPFQNLKNARPFGPAFQRNVIDTFAATFSGHLQALREAAERLGGLPLKISDAGYELKAFECLPLRFHFWDRDEEFDAQANILFDAGATDYIHVESLVTIASQGLYRLAEEAQVPVCGQPF